MCAPAASCRKGTRRMPCSPSAASSGSISGDGRRSEEHTSELQSRLHLVCRLLLEKKKKTPCSPRRACADVRHPCRTPAITLRTHAPPAHLGCRYCRYLTVRFSHSWMLRS